MKKLIMLCASMALLLPLIGQESKTSNIKETYRDATYYQTTVVVKEKGSSDLDVLNQNFDIEEYGMGEVIRITTNADGQTVVQAHTRSMSSSDETQIKPVQVEMKVEEIPSRASQISQEEVASQPKASVQKLPSSPSNEDLKITANGNGERLSKEVQMKRNAHRLQQSSVAKRNRRTSSTSSSKKIHQKKRKRFRLFDFLKAPKSKKFRGKKWGCYSF